MNSESASLRTIAWVESYLILRVLVKEVLTTIAKKSMLDPVYFNLPQKQKLFIAFTSKHLKSQAAKLILPFSNIGLNDIRKVSCLCPQGWQRDGKISHWSFLGKNLRLVLTKNVLKPLWKNTEAVEKIARKICKKIQMVTRGSVWVTASQSFRVACTA